MKSEDLLKAIGNIDDKFIEEAAPKINAVNKTNAAESNDSAKTDDKKLVEIVKVKPRNTFRIVASIAACVCLVAAVSFAIIGSTKSRPQTSDDGSLANKIESSINNMESSDKKTMENSNITSSVSSDISDESNEVSKFTWEELSDRDRYTSFTMNGNHYYNIDYGVCALNDGSEKYIGDEIGEVTAYGTDENGKVHETKAMLYKINNMSSKFAVLADFDDSGVDYAIFRNNDYKPNNLGELIDDLSLKENLSFGFISYGLNSDKTEDRKYIPNGTVSDEEIFNVLFIDRNLKYEPAYKNGTTFECDRYYKTSSNYGYNVDLNETLSLFEGTRYFSMVVTNEGYLVFYFTKVPEANADEITFAFKLSDKQAKDFDNLFKNRKYLTNEEIARDFKSSMSCILPDELSTLNGSESSNSAKLSNTDIPDNYFCAGSKKITSSDVKAIKAGMTYKEIINQLGETANFGQGNIRQYIVDDKLVLPLRFDSLSDVCKKTGEELLKQAIPYKVPERIKDKLNDDIYAVVINDKFISCINGEPDNCCTIDLSDAEIKFENGKTATAADVKPMSSVLISYDMVAESYPGSMHCLKVTILDSNS